VLERLRAQRPDVLMSVSATQKFGGELLSIAPRGCFNSHSGDLPRFRGLMPTFWTLYENEPRATVTVHKMAERIDAGGIWRQSRIPIGPDDSLETVIQRTKRLSASMTWTLFEELDRGDVALQANDETKKSYYKFPGAKESAELRRRGRRLL
jgi:methionyl-tRNA formyltransferase